MHIRYFFNNFSFKEKKLQINISLIALGDVMCNILHHWLSLSIVYALKKINFTVNYYPFIQVL